MFKMINNLKTRIILRLVLIAVFMQAGCFADSSSEYTDSDNTLSLSASGYTMMGYGNMAPSGEGDNLLYITETVSVFNPETGFSPVLLCAQPGCSHRDETCEAWIGDRDQFMCFQGIWYWTVYDNTQTLLLKSYDHESGRRQDLFRYTCNEGGECSNSLMIAENDRIYLQFDELRSNLETGSYDITRRIEKISILSGSHETILETSGSDCWMEGAWNENVVYTRSYLNDELPDLSSLQNSEDIISILEGLEYITELRMLKKDGTDEVIAEQIRDMGTHPFSDSVFTYIEGENTKIHDIETGTCTQAEYRGALSSNVIDHKLFLNTKDQNNTFHYEISDINDLSLFTEIDNNGETDHIAFSIRYETENGFFGVYDQGFGWIRKEDLYAGRYNEVISLGGC